MKCDVWKGLGGNREVSPLSLLGPRGDLGGAGADAIRKEGGAWGPHGSDPKGRDVA
jgi:hypothetical protein